jgi:hypothetical protein
MVQEKGAKEGAIHEGDWPFLLIQYVNPAVQCKEKSCPAGVGCGKSGTIYALCQVQDDIVALSVPRVKGLHFQSPSIAKARGQRLKCPP